MIPLEADAAFVARQVPETCTKPPEHPVMDEQPVQLVKETRTPLPADRPRRVDYERAGAASTFMEALSAWRTARKRRTNRAAEVASLPEGRDRSLASTPTRQGRSTKRPARAREPVRRIEFRYTPKHGSRLNLADPAP